MGVLAKRINPRLVKLHRSYTVADIARVLSVHKNSVRGWQRDAGLKPLDGRRPLLFQGQALRAFLEARQAKRKCPCPPGTFYCFRCRQPRAPALGMVDCANINAVSGNLRALCETCETVMHRRVRLDALASVMPSIAVQIAEAS